MEILHCSLDLWGALEAYLYRLVEVAEHPCCLYKATQIPRDAFPLVFELFSF